MKTTIRQLCFETNSSSVHSIVIGNNREDIYANLPKVQYFKGDSFGWEVRQYNDANTKAAYLWTGIVRLYDEDDINVDELRRSITEILHKYGIEAIFQEVGMIKSKYSDRKYFGFLEDDDYAYIDHSYDLKDFVKIVATDDNLLMNYLYSEGSMIGTGHDNGEDDEEGTVILPKNVLFEYCKCN